MWLNGLDPFFGKISDLNVAFDWRLVHLCCGDPPPKKNRPARQTSTQAGEKIE